MAKTSKYGYLCGPLESFGDPEKNAAAMRAEASKLRDAGWRIHCPAELMTRGSSRAKNQLINMNRLCTPVDALIVMEGYEASHGCMVEIAVAREIGIPVLRYDTLEPLACGSRYSCLVVASDREIHEFTSDGLRASANNSPTCNRIIQKCTEVADLLCEKNRSYGDSALNPARIFAKGSAVELINSRIDDKLNRIKNASGAFGEDVVLDLIGYLILLQLATEDAKHA